MATYYSHWRHALLIHDGDFISTQTVSSAHQILYNDARFLGYTESLEDERLMMEILRGSPCIVGIPNQQTAGTFSGCCPGSHYLRRMSILLTSMRR